MLRHEIEQEPQTPLRFPKIVEARSKTALTSATTLLGFSN
jgi:hypothetical protein